MANTDQLATTVSAQIYTRFCGIAAERNLSNAALLRDTVEELVEAYDDGRATFQKSAQPRLDTTVSGLIHQMREQVIELDRAQADNARMFAKLTEKWNGGEEANRTAFERVARNLQKRDAENFSPFYDAANELLAAFRKSHPELLASLDERLAEISDRLERSIRLASSPRQVRALYLGDDRMLSLKFLSACAGLLLSFGLLTGLLLPGFFSGWSVWQASKLIESPAQMCRLVEKEYGRSDCQLPEHERELGLRIVAHEARR